MHVLFLYIQLFFLSYKHKEERRTSVRSGPTSIIRKNQITEVFLLQQRLKHNRSSYPISTSLLILVNLVLLEQIAPHLLLT